MQKISVVDEKRAPRPDIRKVVELGVSRATRIPVNWLHDSTMINPARLQAVINFVDDFSVAANHPLRYQGEVPRTPISLEALVKHFMFV